VFALCAGNAVRRAGVGRGGATSIGGGGARARAVEARRRPHAAAMAAGVARRSSRRKTGILLVLVVERFALTLCCTIGFSRSNARSYIDMSLVRMCTTQQQQQQQQQRRQQQGADGHMLLVNANGGVGGARRRVRHVSGDLSTLRAAGARRGRIASRHLCRCRGCLSWRRASHQTASTWYNFSFCV
jgi:hypothetical protein